MKMDSHMLMLIWAILSGYFIQCDGIPVSLYQYEQRWELTTPTNGSCKYNWVIDRHLLLVAGGKEATEFNCTIEIEAVARGFTPYDVNYHYTLAVTIHFARITGFLRTYDGRLNGQLKHNLTKTNTVDEWYESTTSYTSGSTMALHIKKDSKDKSDFWFVIGAHILGCPLPEKKEKASVLVNIFSVGNRIA